MEVLNLIRLFAGWVFPYISRIHIAYVGEDSSILGTERNVWWLKGGNFLYYHCNFFTLQHVWGLGLDFVGTTHQEIRPFLGSGIPVGPQVTISFLRESHKFTIVWNMSIFFTHVIRFSEFNREWWVVWEMIHPPHLVFVFQVIFYRFYHGIHHHSTTMMRMNMFCFSTTLANLR